jgi:protein-tyrosine phosphatase
MDTQPTRHLPIAGTYNIRDLGGYATQTGQTRWRALFRADSLHRIDADGVATLVEHGVRTVVDLRQPQELEHQPNPFATHPGVRYHNVSLFEAVVPPPGAADVLLEMYKLALAHRGAALQSILSAIADAEDGAVLFHCTAGKDRTGIVAALLLSVAGVDGETIGRDYAVTAQMIAPMVDELIAGARARGADVESFRPMLASNPETMAAFLEHLTDAYGGVAVYLETIGVDAAARQKLRARLVEERAA